MTDCEKRLQREREKLRRMIDEAFRNDMHVLEDEAVRVQSRRVDKLIEQVERERGRNG